MFKVGKMGHSIRGFSAGHSIKYGLRRVQAMAWEIPVSNQTGMGKAPDMIEIVSFLSIASRCLPTHRRIA